MSRAAAIFDLDRTVLRGSSTPAIMRHLQEAGLANRGFPAERLFQATFDLFGESTVGMRAARGHSGVKPGWTVAEIAEIGETIADELMDRVQPFVPSLLAQHKAAGRTLVLATASNQASIQGLADRLGFDHVVATRWAVDGDSYTGELDGVRLMGAEKCAAVLAWADAEDVDLSQSWAYSDSRYDAPLLSAVGNAVAVNPDVPLAIMAVRRGWTIRFLDKPEGVIKVAGRELQDWLRPLSRPGADPLATIVMEGVENIPAEGGAVLVFNHRSYYDSSAVSYVLGASGRNARFLGKKEVFDVPVAGLVAKAMGGIRVDRGTGSDEPLDRAIDALQGGDIIALAPQGTIPRGPAFFDTDLVGRWGAARLAIAAGVPVIPVALWGTEKVWPRSSRVPTVTMPGRHKPVVTVTVGAPFKITGKDPDKVTKTIMSKLVALLPPEARVKRTPTDAELLATFPPGYKGDPSREAERRPGRDV